MINRLSESRQSIANSMGFPSDGFTYYLTFFSKFFSAFSHGTCSLSVETKSKVKSLSTLRENLNTETNNQIPALKYFNRLALFAQRESDLEKSFAYELCPIPLSLFSEKTQLMHKPDKAEFAQACLKSKVKCVDPYAHRIGSKVIDDGWLHRQVSWEKGQHWKTIISGYVTFVQSICKNVLSLMAMNHQPRTTTIDGDANYSVMT